MSRFEIYESNLSVAIITYYIIPKHSEKMSWKDPIMKQIEMGLVYALLCPFKDVEWNLKWEYKNQVGPLEGVKA